MYLIYYRSQNINLLRIGKTFLLLLNIKSRVENPVLFARPSKWMQTVSTVD